MRRTGRDVSELRRRALSSLVLSIELFNRPQEDGRAEAVLILLHHAFEMLLKATIRMRTGTVHDGAHRYTYSFDRCLTVAEQRLKVLSANERLSLSILDAHRDMAVHFYHDISEDLLYLQAQSGVSLFNDLLSRVFRENLADSLPSRVLPLSTRPPKDLHLLVDMELREVDDLLQAGRRTGPQAAAKLRPILALATASRDDVARVTEKELRRAIARRKKGESWPVIFPEVAQLHLSTEGDGIPFHVQIVKDKNTALPVRVAKEGEVTFGTLFKQEINIWDKFNLSSEDIAKKLGLTGPRTRALILELGLQEDRDCYRELRKGAYCTKGYSKRALDALRQALNAGLDPEVTWQKHGHRLSGRRKAGHG